MESFREIISTELQKNRPNLSAASITTYVSGLTNLAKQMDGEKSLQWFSDARQSILAHLKDAAPSKRKGTLSALFVLTGIQDFRDAMIADCKTVTDDYKRQTKSEKEAENWISPADIERVYASLQAKATKSKFAVKQVFQDFLLVGCVGGVNGLAPRRCMDYALMKIRNFGKDDNFYKCGTKGNPSIFSFSQYKTAKAHGTQVVEVPKELDKYIAKWIKMNETDFMFPTSTGTQPQSSFITKSLNRIFQKELDTTKNVSVDILRHVFITNFYKNTPALKEMTDLADSMGNTVMTQLTQYVKKD